MFNFGEQVNNRDLFKDVQNTPDALELMGKDLLKDDIEEMRNKSTGIIEKNKLENYFQLTQLYNDEVRAQKYAAQINEIAGSEIVGVEQKIRYNKVKYKIIWLGYQEQSNDSLLGIKAGSQVEINFPEEDNTTQAT